MINIILFLGLSKSSIFLSGPGFSVRKSWHWLSCLQIVNSWFRKKESIPFSRVYRVSWWDSKSTNLQYVLLVEKQAKYKMSAILSRQYSDYKHILLGSWTGFSPFFSPIWQALFLQNSTSKTQKKSQNKTSHNNDFYSYFIKQEQKAIYIHTYMFEGEKLYILYIYIFPRVSRVL